MDVKKLEAKIQKAREALRAAKLKEKQQEQKKIVDLVLKSGLSFEQIETLFADAKNVTQAAHAGRLVSGQGGENGE